jgi:RsiW-degrading membrane proteinase PrsW (M82 family)
VGHAAWTGLVCAVLWRQREKTQKPFSALVLFSFIVAVVFHAVWDIAGTAHSLVVTYLGYIGIGIVSLTLLILRLSDARKIAKAKQVHTPG